MAVRVGRFVSAVHVLFIKNGKLLMLRRFNTGWGDGKYSLVAGHVESNETVRNAAVREAIEEAGSEVSVNDLEFVHVMHRLSEVERIDFFFKASVWKYEPKNAEPQKCDDMQWFSIDNLPENTVPYVRFAIENIKKNITYSEFVEEGRNWSV